MVVLKNYKSSPMMTLMAVYIHPAMWYRIWFHKWIASCMPLYIPLVTYVKVLWGYTPLPITAFMACSGTDLLSFFIAASILHSFLPWSASIYAKKKLVCRMPLIGNHACTERVQSNLDVAKSWHSNKTNTGCIHNIILTRASEILEWSHRHKR